RETVRANTFESYRSAVEVHLVPELGHIPLRQLDRATFSTYYSELSRSGRADGGGGLSPRSVRAIHVCGHKALKDAIKDGRAGDHLPPEHRREAALPRLPDLGHHGHASV